MSKWVTVPTEPTDEMWLAFFSCNSIRGTEGMEEFHGWRGDYGNFVASYNAMLAAAPRLGDELVRKERLDEWWGECIETPRPSEAIDDANVREHEAGLDVL